MDKLGDRFKVFAVGVGIGALIGFFLVTHHRKAVRNEQAVLQATLPREGTVDPSVREALAGIFKYYHQQRGPMLHRMIESQLIERDPQGTGFRRELVLQGLFEVQRLRIEEVFELPPPADQLMPAHLTDNDLAGGKVLSWRIAHPSQYTLYLPAAPSEAERAALLKSLSEESFKPVKASENQWVIECLLSDLKVQAQARRQLSQKLPQGVQLASLYVDGK